MASRSSIKAMKTALASMRAASRVTGLSKFDLTPGGGGKAGRF